MTIYVRRSTYHLRRGVPLRFKNVEPREIVAISLHADSRTVAQRKAGEYGRAPYRWMGSRIRMDSDGAFARFEAAKEIADRRGFSYLSAPAVADFPLGDIIARVRTIPHNQDNSPTHIPLAELASVVVENPALLDMPDPARDMARLLGVERTGIHMAKQDKSAS